MLFNSWQFALFFPIVFGLYWGLPHKFRVYLLLVASYWFYMSWNVKYVVLILFTTIISYLAAIFLERYSAKSTRKLILTLTLVACLGVLFVFKYFNFFMEALADFSNMLCFPLHPITLKLLLPVGISFYTFQTLAYVIDVYRGTTKAERNFWVYATFISFFPQLVAGPIERTNNLLPQIKAAHEFKYEQAVEGLKLAAWGLFKKMAIADCVSVSVDKVYGNLGNYSGLVLGAATFLFTVQIYCDFSGYSDIARGCSKMLGIELMENFRSPYFSGSIREFWSRWHISLSTWFRDYVYIPLGGNRCGKVRHNVNLMLTFIVSGLWHGANWTFLVWGMIHGLAQVVENFFTDGRKTERPIIVKYFTIAGTFIFVMLAWVFFRAQSLGDAVYVFEHVFDGIGNPVMYFKNAVNIMRRIQRGVIRTTFMIILLALYDYFSLKYDVMDWLNRRKTIVRWTVYILCALLGFSVCMILLRSAGEFIYFQF